MSPSSKTATSHGKKPVTGSISAMPSFAAIEPQYRLGTARRSRERLSTLVRYLRSYKAI